MNEALFSSKSNEWETPIDFFKELDKEFHFTLDPCSTHENAKCEKHFTMQEDGLAQSWKGETVFCNPPYGRELPKWIEKCAREAGGYARCHAYSGEDGHESISRIHLQQGRNSLFAWALEIWRITKQRSLSVNGRRLSMNFQT